MEYRQLGRTDVMVSQCCLGTMTWGEQNTEAEGHAQMDYAVERGVNFFDTAELYPIPPRPETQGSTERIIGNWLKSRKNRDKIILATKVVGRTNQTWHRSFETDQCRQTKAAIDDAVEQSLKRLQTDYIDLYQLHWPDRVVGLFGGRAPFETMQSEFEAFEDILDHLGRHIDAGWIRHIGVSNETPYGVMRFLAESDARGLPRIQSIQNAYNLVNRTFDGSFAEITAHEQVGLLAYSPLAQGYLTGKYRNEALPDGSRKQLFERLGRYESAEGLAAIESYLAFAETNGFNPAQLAIRFCDTRAFTTSTIIGATSMAQLETCLDSFALAWNEDIEAELTRLHLAQPSPSP